MANGDLEILSRTGTRVEISPILSNRETADTETQDSEREYRSLIRKWWFGAVVGTFTMMIMSYPWLFPVLRDWFPRESHSLWYVWAFMGVAALAVIGYSGWHFFIGAWQALKHRSANTVPVEFLPKEPGEYEFSCQMGMFRGKLIVE